MTKFCTLCKAEKSLGEFGKNRCAKDGLQSRCKPCHVKSVVSSQRHNPDGARKRRATWKARHRESDLAGRRAYSARYYLKNTEAMREAARARNHDRIEEIRALRHTPEGQVGERERKLARRTREANGNLPVGRLPRALVIGIKAAFGNCCIYCGAATELELDHFNPLKRGGLHTRGNLVAACSDCNDRKAFLDPFDWMAANGVDSDRVVAAICEAAA